MNFSSFAGRTVTRMGDGIKTGQYGYAIQRFEKSSFTAEVIAMLVILVIGAIVVGVTA